MRLRDPALTAVPGAAPEPVAGQILVEHLEFLAFLVGGSVVLHASVMTALGPYRPDKARARATLAAARLRDVGGGCYRLAEPLRERPDRPSSNPTLWRRWAKSAASRNRLVIQP